MQQCLTSVWGEKVAWVGKFKVHPATKTSNFLKKVNTFDVIPALVGGLFLNAGMMGFPAFTYFLLRVGSGRLLLEQRCGVGYLLIFAQPFNNRRYA
jgi:hypothetical protein